jgi:hypothetical protein
LYVRRDAMPFFPGGQVGNKENKTKVGALLTERADLCF